MIATMSLQFQGSQNGLLLAGLLAAATLLLVGLAARQVTARQWRSGVAVLAAALTPVVFVPVMLLEAGRRYRCGDKRGGRHAWLSAVAAAAALTMAASVVAAAGVSRPVVLAALAGMQVAMAVGVFYAGAFERLGVGRLTALMGLRSLAIGALLAVLLQPAAAMLPTGEALKPLLSIFVDRSASMAATDGALPERYTQALEMLASQRVRIEQTYRPIWGHFAAAPQRVGALAELADLSPRGDGTDQTDLAAAIRMAAHSARRRPRAILLITDGNHNGPEDVLQAAAEARAPIYALGVGALTEPPTARRNIEIVSVDAPLTAGANVAATIKVAVRMTHWANTPAEARLFDRRDPTPLLVEGIWTDQPDATKTIALDWTPKDRPDDDGSTSAPSPVVHLRLAIPPGDGEIVSDDNEAIVHVLVTHPKIRVLYIEGTVRPEYKYLRRHLDSDPNIELISLVRIRDRRFWARGRIGDKTLTALPAGEADFAIFDVIILGDLDSGFWDETALKRLEAFVDRGGGLVMLGGTSSFGPGGYGGTAVEDALPVHMGPRETVSPTAPFSPRLTAAGDAHPILRGITNFFAGADGRAAQGDLAALRGCSGAAGAKPAATVLAVHPTQANAAGPLVVLAVQSYGAGRSAAFTADTTWQWDLPMRATGADSPYVRFWSQLVRWLAGAEDRHEGSAVVARLRRTYIPAGEAISVTAAVAAGEGADPGDVRVVCELMAAEGEEIITSQPMRANDDGVFSAELAGPSPGRYRLGVRAADGKGRPLGEDMLAVQVASPPTELDRLARNERLLGDVADRTGGRYADLTALPEIVDALWMAPAGAEMAATTYKLYHLPWLFVLFVAAVTCEWVLRRRWELT